MIRLRTNAMNLSNIAKASLLALAMSLPHIADASGTWNARFIDPFGYVPLTSIVTDKNLLVQIGKLERGDSGVYDEFAKLYEKDDRDLATYFGLMLSAQASNRLGTALELVASHYDRIRRAELRRGIRVPHVPPKQYVIAFGLGVCLGRNGGIAGSSRKAPLSINDLGPTAQSYFGVLGSGASDYLDLARPECVLVGCILLQSMEYSLARKVLKSFSVAHPQDVVFHLLLARAYSCGVVAYIRGGKQVAAPVAEAADENLVRRELSTALRIAPESPEALYLAGNAWLTKDRERAAIYWRKYLTKTVDRDYRERRAYILKTLPAVGRP